MSALEIIAMVILICFGLFIIGAIVYCFSYAKGFKDMREIFHTFIKNQWISVEDELPEECLDDEGIPLDFIVWSEDYTHARAAYFNGDNFYFECFDGSECIMYSITHWQPLPNPPKEKVE